MHVLPESFTQFLTTEMETQAEQCLSTVHIKQDLLVVITTHKLMNTRDQIKLLLFLTTFQEHKKFKLKFGAQVVQELFITMV